MKRNAVLVTAAAALLAAFTVKGLMPTSEPPSEPSSLPSPSLPSVPSNAAASKAVILPPAAAAPMILPKKSLAKVKTHPSLQRATLRRQAGPVSTVPAGLAPGVFADGRVSPPAPASAAYRPERAAAPAKIARREKNMSNPMENRWVKSLSGAGARVNMGRDAAPIGKCSQTRACERQVLPQQAWVAGVVMTTERVAASPSEPLDGRFAKGHYLDDTPGVYVQ